MNTTLGSAQVALADSVARAFAYAIDASVLSVPMAIVVFRSDMDPASVVVATQFVYLLYFISAWAWRGQTLGMRVLGIRIVRLDGKPLGLIHASIRYVALLVGSALLLIGPLWMFIDVRRQALHDKVAGTLVIR